MFHPNDPLPIPVLHHGALDDTEQFDLYTSATIHDALASAHLKAHIRGHVHAFTSDPLLSDVPPIPDMPTALGGPTDTPLPKTLAHLSAHAKRRAPKPASTPPASSPGRPRPYSGLTPTAGTAAEPARDLLS